MAPAAQSKRNDRRKRKQKCRRSRRRPPAFANIHVHFEEWLKANGVKRRQPKGADRKKSDGVWCGSKQMIKTQMRV